MINQALQSQYDCVLVFQKVYFICLLPYVKIVFNI